jgi:hypothetical protein
LARPTRAKLYGVFQRTDDYVEAGGTGGQGSCVADRIGVMIPIGTSFDSAAVRGKLLEERVRIADTCNGEKALPTQALDGPLIAGLPGNEREWLQRNLEQRELWERTLHALSYALRDIERHGLSRDHRAVRSGKTRYRLAQWTGRQETLGVSVRAEDNHVQVAPDAAMLKGVIQNGHVTPAARGRLDAAYSVSIGDDGNVRREDRVRTRLVIAHTAHNERRLGPCGFEAQRQIRREWRFSCSPDAQVADAQHWDRRRRTVKHSGVVQRIARSHDGTKRQAQRRKSCPA